MVRGGIRPELPDRSESANRPTRLGRRDHYPRLVSPWSRAFRVFYWVIRRLDPLVRPVSSRVQIGNFVELGVIGRRSGRRRVVLLGLLRVDGVWYLGHPNGPTHWTRNLDASGGGTLRFAGLEPHPIRAELLPPGEERRRVIGVTWRQQLFPGSLMYWLGRRHILAVGRYYRVELT
jgi:hypothetical protein